MGSKSDDLENFSIGKAMEYIIKRSKRRSKEKKENKKLGKDLVDFIYRDNRAETGLDETIEAFFAESIQNLSADPAGNIDLVESATALIYNKMFRVEHPRLRKLLTIDFEATFFEALGKHSQIERAIENEVDIDTLRKTKISSFLVGLRNKFGKNTQEDDQWTS